MTSTCLHAVDPVPGIINHQGRIAVSSADFTGNGLFCFSLVSGAGVVLWHHDGTPTGSAQPATQLTILVDAGLYSVTLGDTGLAGMTAIPATVFQNGDVRLRIWFDDQAPVAMQQMSPDIRIASAGYAQRAAMIEDGAITGASVLNASLTGADLSNAAALSNAQVNDDLTIAGGTVNSSIIGGSSPAAASFTTVNASGATTLA
ncbi:MAG: hypothetical protein H0X45_11450, partial [Planctomycetes bacterium]|nr:hypothetical protein [Planctomycetota bacterium]